MNEGEQWIARFIEKDLSPEEAAALNRLLEADPALRARLGAQASLHGLLGPAAEDDLAGERVANRYSEAVRQADEQQFERGVRRKLRKVLLWRRASWAAAVALLLGAGLLTWMRIPEPVATVSRVESVTGAAALAAGDTLTRGSRLELNGGLVELDLGGRGRMIIEGPADLEFTGPTSAVLKKGRVLLHVTPAGHGYRLETPRGALVDLGTEFGVFVDDQTGQVETHVLAGEVEAIPLGGIQPILLQQDEALQQTGDLNVRIPAARGSFYASLPPVRHGPSAMIHWDMETNDTSIIRARTRGLEEEGLGLKFFVGDRKISPPTVDGPFDAAVSFDGRRSFGESEFKGIAGKSPRTVAFWVKVPSDFKPRHGFAMVSWGEWVPENPGGVWQISVNTFSEDGAVGRLRVGVHGGMAIGSTDLRDDQWHHIAVVLYPAENPEFGQHVLLYVDGALEPVSQRILGVIDTSTQDASHGVWLGRNINIDSGYQFFRGALDEVYIFDSALSPQEIRNIMEHNEPPR